MSDNKVALVTGASRGIGKACALELARRGCDIAANYCSNAEQAAKTVAEIEALGKEFDPNFHNAVMQVQSEEYESGIVAQEFQKGYLYHDSVIRHSMVGVAE